METKNIAIVGASFETGNLGVSALGWSSIRLLLSKWPNANVEIVASGWSRDQSCIEIDGSEFKMNTWPVRFCANAFVPDHFWKLLFGVIIIRLFPFMRSVFAKRQSTLGAICRADVVADITGGDSFSDMYGMKRFVLGYLTKRICQLTGKPFVMLPQTYGPFKRSFSSYLAARILKRATRIFSRDKEGLSVVRELIGETEKLALSPDVAFVLEPKVPEQSQISDRQLADIVSGQSPNKVVGLNISGLLYNGGFTGNNEFGLKCAYRELIGEIISYFSSIPDTKVLLVPHVVPDLFEVENDLTACHQVRDSLSDDLKEKVLIAEPEGRDPFFDQCEIKYIIGKCDFFMGSRMHSTIAAISQCIPTAGLAYSKKFAGVYETVGVDDCVVDLREMDNVEVMESVKAIFEKKQEIKQRLEENIPEVKQKVFQLFDNL